MSITLMEVVAAAQARCVPFVGETAGYLVLGAADQVLDAPRAITARDIVLTEEGSVRIVGGSAALERVAESSLRALLEELLLCASGANGALFRTARRAGGGRIETLIRELEAALIPANRAAARRCLSRLSRDTERAKTAGAFGLSPALPSSHEPVRARSQVALRQVEAQAPFDSVPTLLEPPRVTEAIAVELQSRSSSSLLRPDEAAHESDDDLEHRPLGEPSPLPAITIDVDLSALSLPEPATLAAPDAADRTVETEFGESESTSCTGPLKEQTVPPEVAETTPRDTPYAELTPLEPIIERAQRRLDAYEPSLSNTPYLGSYGGVIELCYVPAASMTASDPSVPAGVRPMDENERESKLDPEASSEQSVPIFYPYELQDGGIPVIVEQALEEWPRPTLVAEAPPVTPEPEPAMEPMQPRASRLAPRKSDVDELLSRFTIAEHRSDRQLCRDLKSMAGVELTPHTQATISSTPPPVSATVEERDQGATRNAGGRLIPSRTISILAMVGLVVLAGAAQHLVGNATSLAAARPGTDATEPPAAFRVPDAPACQATLVVEQAPGGAEIRVRPARTDLELEPRVATGPAAKFAGLPCREPFEVSVRLPVSGAPVWRRIPVSAAELTPSAHQSDVSLTLDAR